jgi:hypothetical protein
MLETLKDLLGQLSEYKEIVVPILGFLGGFVTLATTIAARRTYRIQEHHTYTHAPAIPAPVPYGPPGTSNWRRLGRILVCLLVLSGCEGVLNELRRQLFLGLTDPQQANTIGTACVLVQWLMLFLILINALRIVVRLVAIALR